MILDNGTPQPLLSYGPFGSKETLCIFRGERCYVEFYCKLDIWVSRVWGTSYYMEI